MSTFQAGDLVVRNPAHWKSGNADRWGYGKGLGTVLCSVFTSESGETIHVGWLNGTCQHHPDEIQFAPKEMTRPLMQAIWDGCVEQGLA